MKWNAYHFVGNTLRDGSPVPDDGVTLTHDGEIELCRSGFHASRKAWQALAYAPGHTLCRVCVGGKVIEPSGEDKLVATERTIISRIDAEALLREFTRSCARDVLPLWDAPDVVVRYLESGDEKLRAAARDAAWAAARDAAWDAAWDAAQAAARAAAWAAARAAARAMQNKKQRARLTKMVNAAFEAKS